MPSTEDQLAIFQLLARAGVPFVIIGGHAVTFHGYLRTTEDADVIFQRTPASEAALLTALESIHACWISNERDPATGHERLVPASPAYVRGEHLMMLTTDLGFLDLYDYIPGFPDTSVAEVFADSIAMDNLRFVSARWLRKLKLVAGRHKDLDDLEHLPPALHEESHVTTAKTERIYHRLVVLADPETVIWLVDDSWHLVQKAIGALDTSVLPGRYFVELGATALENTAYPIELFSDLRLTQDVLEAGPTCRRQPPKVLDE